MAFPESINASLPPDTGESPRLGAQRMREIKQFLIDLFGLQAAPAQYTSQAMSIALDGTVTLKGSVQQILTNNTGVGLIAGDVVTNNGSADNSVVLGDFAPSMRVFYIAAATIANAASGLFYTGPGIIPAVRTQGAVTRGNYLRKSGTTLALEDTGILANALIGAPLGAVGIALTASAGPTGTVAMEWFGPQPQAPGSLLRFTAFTANGTWNKGNRTRMALVAVIGGGGAGGGVSDAAAGAACGAGGGGGGCALKLIDVTAIASATIVVGAATTGTTGAGGTGANNSWSDGTNTLTGNGGTGGTQMAHTAGSSAVNSGSGGTGTGGDINIRGGEGGNGIICAGALATTPFGGAGGAPYGGPNRRSPTVSGIGLAGNAAGGGGSGAVDTAAATRNGGDGAVGAVYVWEYT